MTRLVFAELRAGWASWVGVVFVAAVASLACGVAISLLETGIHAGQKYLEGFSGGTAAILMFSAPAAIAVTAAITRLAVDLGRPGYARWQLAGVGPVQTAGVVLAQLFVAGLVGGAIGFGATTLVAGPVIHSAFADGSGEYAAIPVVTGPLTAGVAIPATVVLVLLGGLRAARAAGRTPALAALREPEARAKRMRWWRWLLLAAAVAGAAWFFSAVFQARTTTELLMTAPLTPVILAVLVVLSGPVVYPIVLRAWTGLVPARASTSWHLARHQARYHLGRSTASITPLFVGASLLGGLFTMSATFDASLRAAGERGVTLGIAQVALMIGGPVLLAAVGAAVVIFMSNRTQGSEQALLRASGAAPGVVLATAVWQAVIHVVTAALLAAAVLVATALIDGAALARLGPGIPVVAPGFGLALVGVGLALTLAATVLPVLARSREPLVTGLAAV